jgi:two-component system cell cycle sensor histidine kinase PleC
MVEADSWAFKQIILNLISNAVKFTRENGRIEITLVANAEQLDVSVSDNGIGIPADDLARIGNAFEQASNDPLRAREGTGLGLALVRALVWQHGGSLRIESVEGVGTTVSFEMPRFQQGSQTAYRNTAAC